MKLTDEQRTTIANSMYDANQGSNSDQTYINMLAAGMRELSKIYYDQNPEDDFDSGDFAYFLREAADDLEAK